MSSVSVGKSVWEPEGPLGSTVRRTFSFASDYGRITELAAEGGVDLLRRAENSLDKRCAGVYEGTSRAYYMSRSYRHQTSMNHEGGTAEPSRTASIAQENMVLFLHQFGDTANARHYDYSAMPFLDYFDMALHVLESFAAAKQPLHFKFHPLTGRYRGDAPASAVIKDLIQNSEYLHQLPGSFNARDLSLLPNPVAITGRGSIAVETAYLNIPTLLLVDSCMVEAGLGERMESLDSLQSQATRLAKGPRPKTRDKAIFYEAGLLAAQEHRFFLLENFSRESTEQFSIKGYREF